MNVPNTQNLNTFSWTSNDTQFSNMSMNMNHAPDTQMDVDEMNLSALSPVLSRHPSSHMQCGESNDVTLSQSFLELNLAESEQQNTNGEIYNFEKALGYDINRNDDGDQPDANGHYAKVRVGTTNSFRFRI